MAHGSWLGGGSGGGGGPGAPAGPPSLADQSLVNRFMQAINRIMQPINRLVRFIINKCNQQTVHEIK